MNTENIEDLLQVAERALYRDRGHYLTDLQKSILQGTLQGELYRDTSLSVYKSEATLRNEGAKLWQWLSRALGEKVTKCNVKAALSRHQR